MSTEPGNTQKPEQRAQTSRGGVDAIVSLPAVLDACCGGRMMWFDKQDKRAFFIDKRRAEIITDTREGRSPYTVDPDEVMDFTDLKFEDGVFSLVVFDPPHLVDISEKSWLGKKYGTLKNGWELEIEKGFSECFRVLKPNGVLIFK